MTFGYYGYITRSLSELPLSSRHLSFCDRYHIITAKEAQLLEEVERGPSNLSFELSVLTYLVRRSSVHDIDGE